MKFVNLKSVVLPLSIVAVFAFTPSVESARAAGYGTFSGQIVLDGDIPKLKPKVAKNADVRDKQCCAAKNVANDELVVNKDNKGIQHIFIFLRSKVSKSDIHPDLKNSKTKEVVFDQESCQFKPHSLLVRTDQQVVVKSADNTSHNTHTYSIFNPGENFIVSANDRVGVKMPKFALKERLPFEVKCDIHNWMRAWWLVVDHPYAAITDKDGKFKIEKLPAGEHTFTIWHERVGYIEKTFKVDIENGKTVTVGDKGILSVKLAEFEVKDDEKE
jgi:plastocyanin